MNDNDNKKVAPKSIFITGAGSGIGRETAIFFASKGWFVGLFSTTEEKLFALAEEIGIKNCCYQAMDVTNTESVQSAVDLFAQKTDGRMDVMFNCAGILNMGRHDTIPLDTQRKIVDVNFNGTMNCIYAGFDLLKQTPSSRIINMSSASALYGTPELAVYSATKFAVIGLTEALNIEYAQHDIFVCDVMAPYVETAMITNAKVQATSVKRLGVRLQPKHVAEVVWKAAHGKKVHWRVGFLLKLLVFARWAFPFASRPLTRLLAYTPQVEKGENYSASPRIKKTIT